MKNIFTLLLTIFIISSCSSDENNDSDNNVIFQDGYFIINKGEFWNEGSYESSISFRSYNIDSDHNYDFQDIFNLVNNEKINGVIEDFTVDTQFAYILVNNRTNDDEDQLIVLDKHTFKIIRRIYNSIENPKKIITYQDKAFVIGSIDPNQQGSYKINIINTRTGGFITSIDNVNLNYNSFLLINGNDIYVTNANYTSRIFKIDAISNSVTNTFITEVEINSMVFANNKLHICGENVNEDYSTISSINTNSGSITQKIIKHYKSLQHLTYSNGLFSFISFDSTYSPLPGTIYNWDGLGSTLTNSFDREIHGYGFNSRITSFTMKDRLIYITYDDSTNILDTIEKSYILMSTSGPNTNKIVFY